MAATAAQTNLAGLPRRLVQDGLISEDKLVEAADLAKKDKVSLVAYLVNEDLADARAIAVAASHEFGVPLMDLDALEIDQQLAVIVNRQGPVRKDLSRAEKLLAHIGGVVFLACQQVSHRHRGTVAQVRQRIAQNFQRGNAGVMDIEIRPQ